MFFFLFLILLALVTLVFVHCQKYYQAQELYHQAQVIEKKDRRNSDDINVLKEALTIYKQCSKLVDNARYIQAANHCQQKINERLKFKSLVAQGETKLRQNYFQEALKNFVQAQQLFSTIELENTINKCQNGIERQKKYEQILEQVIQLARQGQFSAAIEFLTPAIEDFSRQDGQQLLNKLTIAIQGKDLYQLGVTAEHQGQINNAIAHYQQALDIIPNFIDCKLRLAIITVQQNPQQAITYLTGIEIEQAIYIRGFAHIQLENWQQAEQEWNLIDHPRITVQRRILKDIIERDRLSTMWEIEQLIDQQQLEIARSISLEFLQKYQDDSVVKQNLNNHIQPSLEHQVWHSQNWKIIASKTEQIWLEQQDIKSLHNWAIATYYQAQTDSNHLTNFIIAWLTALANLKLNPVFKDIPWLGHNSIDIQDVDDQLEQILEGAIELIKDNNLPEYLKLRDVYRRDLMMLFLSRENNCGVRIKKQLLILPNCYQRFKLYLPQIKFPAKIWSALYTDWGMAVAACQAEDIARAIKIKPDENPVSNADRFASYFVSYQEGCHYLANLDWRKAIKSFQLAQLEINNQPDWGNKINQLCELQRRQIKEFEEHLEFSQSWYFLIANSESKSYYVEHQAMQIGFEVDNGKINFKQALEKLRKLQNIDSTNSVAFKIRQTLEVNLELETINHLWQQSNYETAIKIAKRSRHEQVRFAVAEVCLEIVLEILQSGNLTNEAILSLAKITEWAYDLCPHEPSFQAVYSQLKQLGIRY
jgi:tetratricopeptide (TPR) repeat protein